MPNPFEAAKRKREERIKEAKRINRAQDKRREQEAESGGWRPNVGAQFEQLLKGGRGMVPGLKRKRKSQ